MPALELVAVVAQADAGADGLYRLRMDRTSSTAWSAGPSRTSAW